MAVSISFPPTLMSPLAIIVSFIMLVHNVNSATFNYSGFGPYAYDISFQGDASNSHGVLQLTSIDAYGAPLPNSAGRASYDAPVHLWDSKTGELAGFTTSFLFDVEITKPGLHGDGLSFFITTFYSKIPENSTGGFLGLVSKDTAFNAYQNQIVAVEFDTFANTWDPVSSHVGIDINSIVSATTAPWRNVDYFSPSTAFATVSYEPVSKNLSVVVKQGNEIVPSINLSYVIDLRTVLPEWVRVGFSGATGLLVEAHKIYSWSFNSSLT